MPNDKERLARMNMVNASLRETLCGLQKNNAHLKVTNERLRENLDRLTEITTDFVRVWSCPSD